MVSLLREESQMQLNRLYTLATAAALAIACALPAQQSSAGGEITYSPGARRYHLVSVVKRTQEQGGQKAEFTITNEQRVSVNIAQHGKDTLDFTYTLDSTHLTTNPPVHLPDVSRIRGTKVTGSMSPTGRVYEHKSSLAEDDAEARNLVEGMTRFLVTLPKGAKAGTTWADTASNSVKSDGNNLDMRTITTSKILGDTTFDGERAWRVERTSVLSLSGDQNHNGQLLKVAGQGKGSGMYYLSASGVYLGSSAKQHMAMTISIPGTGQSIPVTQEVESRVELVK
jgi:hypothetical protein